MIRARACALALLATFGATAAAAQPRIETPRLVRDALARRGALPPRWPRRPLLDVASAAVGAPVARERSGASGAGATVCVVDTGVDLAHRDLRDIDDRTRVRWLLDLDAAPRGVHADLEAQSGGAVWSGDELDAALASGGLVPRDWHGHGTAVASAAAGDDAGAGESAAGPLAGIAPAAALVVVRALRRGAAGFHDDDVARGARFCLAVAGRGPRPIDPRRVVIVLGLGGHDGAHDGSDPLELELASLAESGVPIVVAAGVRRGVAEHAGATLARGEEIAIPLRVPAPEGAPGARHVAVVLSTGRDAPLEVALEAPDGTRTEWVGASGTASADHDGGRLTVSAEPEPRERTRVVYAIATGGGDVPRPLAGGRYEVHVRGPGRFDAWIAGADVGAALLPPRFDGPLADERESIAVPATSPAVISVGAIVSRRALGDLVLRDDAEGDVASFSPIGPTAAGAPKPDVLAPGGLVVTALSHDVDPDDPESLFGGSAVVLAAHRVGSDRVAVHGTSFAAPIVAGALALALELAESAGERDRRLIAASATRIAGAAWSATSGAGVLDVPRFLRMRARASNGAPDARMSSFVLTRDAVAPGAGDLWLFARVLDRDARPIDGELSIARGGATEAFAIVGGIARAPLGVDATASGEIVEWTADAAGVRIGSARVVVSRGDARAAIAPSGGGCATAPASSAPLCCAFALLALLARRRAVTRRDRRGP